MEDLMKRVAFAVGLTVLLGLFAVDAAAQHGSVMGKVVDPNDQPVADALVKVSSPTGETRSFDAKTNKNGEFGIVTFQSKGPWALTITKEGYADYQHFEPIVAALGGAPVKLGTLKIGSKDAKLKYVSQEEYAKMQAESKAMQAQFQQAVLLSQEADTAMAAGDTAGANAKYDQALAIYSGITATAPDLAEPHHNVGYINGRKQAWAESAEAYIKAAKLKPTMANDYAAAAVGLQNSGQRARAIEVLNEGATQYPTNARIQLALGEVYYNSAKYPEATVAFKKTQELDATMAEPLYYLGMIAVSQNRTQDCITLLESYLALNPTNAQTVEAAKGVLGALKPAKRK
jgi:tetratricopeptide (TPR) repeat protein